MSGINGDKARFHRERKKRIAKRQRTRKLLNLGPGIQVHKPTPGSKPRAVQE